MDKKTIVFVSNHSKLATGFGKNAKEVLKFLFSTGKYNIIEYCAAPFTWNDERLRCLPWKAHGALPDNPAEVQHLLSDPKNSRSVQYGEYNIDRIIQEYHPELVVCCEDCWGFTTYHQKSWSKSINILYWVTLDSLPIIDLAKDQAKFSPYFWVWTSFAEKEMKKLGLDHVNTVHGVIDQSKFFPIDEENRSKIRKDNNISDDTLVFGFVFRNQLRKLVGTLIKGFAEFKKLNPKTKAKLLLHTNVSEGWNIKKFIEMYKVANDDVLFTHICAACKRIQVKPLSENLNCPFCKAEKSQYTPRIEKGCSDEDLNIIYNIMDAYVHPMTSGGLELPILEACLAGLPIATVPYACGEDFTKCKDVFSLKYHEYFEFGSQFIKSQPTPESITKFMTKISSLDKKKLNELGLNCRKFVLEEFNNQKTFKELENLIDSIQQKEVISNIEFQPRDENYPLKDISNNTEWLIDLYENCLRMNEDENSEGVKHWLNVLTNGGTREIIHDYFIKVARKENLENSKFSYEHVFENNGKKKLAYVMPQSLGDCFISTAILESMLDIYPLEEWDYYVATSKPYFEIFENLGYIKQVIEYNSIMDLPRWWEGAGTLKGHVDIAFQPYLTTQRLYSYTHNGIDKDSIQTEINNLK